MNSKEWTEFYFNFLTTFEVNGSKTFTKIEFLKWLQRAHPVYPFKDDWYLISDALAAGNDSSVVDSAKKVAHIWLKKLINFASRCVEGENTVEMTYETVTAPDGSVEDVTETIIIGKDVPILDPKWRREVFFNKKTKLWNIRKLGELITKDDRSRETLTQEVIQKAEGAVKKHRKRNKRADDADGIGDMHVSCRKMTVSIRGLEDKQMDNHLKVFKELLESDVEEEIENLKQDALENSEEMKRKDARIAELESRLGIERSEPGYSV